ncbi:MAG: DUF488 family protein [Verrucomicrobiae bacterium]|nr:DUF488 family protein [Verrucomicrobiae bacterium]
MNPHPSTYRYGSARASGEGLRIGVARHLPRGVRREDWAKRSYFDLWLPLLAPPPALVKDYLGKKITWTVFSRRYRTEMKKSECRQVIDLLAGFSRETSLSLGCFCEDESRCHRSVLQQLITKRRDELPSCNANPRSPSRKPLQSMPRFASPVCYADWGEEES